MGDQTASPAVTVKSPAFARCLVSGFEVLVLTNTSQCLPQQSVIDLEIRCDELCFSRKQTFLS